MIVCGIEILAFLEKKKIIYILKQYLCLINISTHVIVPLLCTPILSLVFEADCEGLFIDSR